jgi:iron complex outermembrane recepter protein
MRFKPSAAALLSVSMIALAAPAAAQDQAAAAPALEEAETIIVTGSRLARDLNSIAPLPVSTVTASDLRAAGNVDATATLRQIPALISSGTIGDSIERGAGGVGQATLNLRQLGAARTLVLVDGRRHVSGVAGSQIVDVATIPSALIESVEVLTGGASAVYGADAVTGVVNYKLKRDFEGLDLQAQTGISTYGDAHSFTFNGTWGKNFNDGRGNITVSAGYSNDQEVLLGDRPFTAGNGRANNSTTYGHPDRRFQKGDIDPATMPNFAARYSLTNGRLPFGFSVPTPAQVTTLFPGGITAAERALVDRAANAPLFKIAADPRFAISSGQGLLFRSDFGFFNADINGNGTNDCEESYIGLTGFGGGGCYVTTPGGGVKIYEDGIVSTGQNQFGGDGAVERDVASLVPQSERYYLNVKGQYEFAPSVELFWDAKYARTNTLSRNNYNTFYDTLFIAPDNPWIPAVLQADADDAGGLLISRDFLDLGPNTSRAERDTYRIVGGLRGELAPALRYDFAVNYGRTDSKVTQGNSVQYDRLFAAIDAVRAPNGQIVCRSDLDPTALHPGSEIFPVIEPGFFTFRPGDGQCRPANILAGSTSLSQDAVNFITTPTTDRFRIEQFVATLAFSGDTSSFFELPGGAVQWAGGFEYRSENSRSTFSDLEKGLLPEGSPAGPAGTFIGDISGNQSLLFDAATRTFDASGNFDVKEVFGEIRIPILKERPFFYELSIEAAGRYADYSTIGGAFTWNIGGTWAPVRDVRLRGSYSKAIRAPNIDELFSPQQGATFRPSDPCNASTISALLADGAANAANRQANCATTLTALGVNPATYEDPLTARFSGTAGGNPDLTEETATTWTVGGVIQPSFLPGFTFSADYYSIEIEDAISAVTAQDTVDTCYDLDTFPNQFCTLFTRRADGGLNFLRQTDLNFGRIETSGVDASLAYNFDIGANRFNLRGAVNWVEKLDRFFDPVNKDLVNPGLGELSAPEWAGLGSLTWGRGPIDVTWRTQYVGKQAIASVIQIERIDLEFGAEGYARAYWLHDVSFNFEFNEGFEFYGGINNLTNAKPYLASSAYPVSGVGRSYFLGMRGKF